jgi:hypothetical protein
MYRSTLLILLIGLFVGCETSPKRVAVPLPAVRYSDNEPKRESAGYGPQATHERMFKLHSTKAIPAERLNIGFGTTANDGTGDSLRTFASKANSNFVELYANLTTVSNLAAAGGGGATTKMETNNGTSWNQRAYSLTNKATGTTTFRSIDDRFVEVFNVMDYGAVGDGSNDDTAAFQAAFNAAAQATQGGKVWIPFPPFAYRTSNTLTITNIFVNIEGAGPGVRVYNAGTGDHIRITAGNVQLKNFASWGQGSSYGTNAIDGHGIVISGADYITMENVSVRYHGTNGIHVHNIASSIALYGCDVRHNRGDGLNSETPSGSEQNGNGLFISGGWYNLNYGNGIKWTAAGLSVGGAHFEANRGAGISINSTNSVITTKNANIVGNYFEQNVSGQIAIRAGAGLYGAYIAGNYFRYGSSPDTTETALIVGSGSGSMQFLHIGPNTYSTTGSEITHWVDLGNRPTSSCYVDTMDNASLFTQLGSAKTPPFLKSTDIDTASEFFTINGDYTGSGGFVRQSNPQIGTSIGVGTAASGTATTPIQSSGSANASMFNQIENTSTGTSAAALFRYKITGGDYAEVGAISPNHASTLVANRMYFAPSTGLDGSILALNSGDDHKVSVNGTVVETVDSTGVHASAVTVNDDAYAAGWNGSTNVPTKNAVYDQVELKVSTTSIDTSAELASILGDEVGTSGFFIRVGGTAANGKVPKYNTDGTITWQDDEDSGGVGSSIAIIDVTQSPYNAVGDDSTDDTTAIQTALDAGPAYYFFPPNKTFRVSTLYPTNKSVLMGGGTLKKKADSLGYIVESGTNFVTVEGLRFDGNGSGTNYTSSTVGGVHGLQLYGGFGVAEAARNKFVHFNGRAIVVDGVDNATTRPNGYVVSGNWGTNNQTGIYLASTNRAEYGRVSDNEFTRGYFGLYNGSANVTVNGGDYSDNEYGIYAKPSNGRSHSVYSGVTVNHSRVANYNASTGLSYNGCHFLGGTAISLLGDAGGATEYTRDVWFRGCYFESPTITDFSGGTNFFDGNTFRSGLTFAGTSRSVYFQNNKDEKGEPLNLTVSKTGAYTIKAHEGGVVWDIDGASAKVAFTLPAAAEGLGPYKIKITDSDGADIIAVGNDTITYGTITTAAAATISSTAIGSVIELRGSSDSNWEATVVGTWPGLAAPTQTGTHASPTTTNPLAPTWEGPIHTVWYGATGEIDLPAVATYTGRVILIYNTGAFTITVDPNSSDVIVRDGTVQSGGVSMTLSSGAGNYVALFCDGARWVSLGFKGTLGEGS